MVGVVQRGQADIAMTLVRVDTMGDSPVRLGPTVAAADTVILGTKLTNETSSPTFVTDVIYNVDATTYLLFLVLLSIVVTILSTSQVIGKKPFSLRRLKRRLPKIVRTINWNILSLMVDQEDFHLKLWSGRFMWVHFNLAILILVFGYVWNSMSTDITVSKPATYIESIDYFLDTSPENRRKPIAMKNLIFHTASKMADPNSKLGKLNHILDTTPGSYFVMDSSDSKLGSSINAMMSEVLNGSSVMIYPELLLNLYLKRAGCTIQPEVMTQIHTSKQSMTPGTLHPIFSHRMPRAMLDYLEYQFQTALEFDLANVMLDFVIGRLMAENQMPRTPAYYKCMEHVVEEESPLKQFMTLYNINNTIRVIVILVILAMIVLVFEIICMVVNPNRISTETVVKPLNKKKKSVSKIAVSPKSQSVVKNEKELLPTSL